MFFDELTPIFKELASHPVSFFGGFFSGLFRLNLADDPVRGWLDKQNGTSPSSFAAGESHNGKSQGPQSISID